MPSPRAEAAARWAFLRDWLRVLQEHLDYVEREDLDCSSLQSELQTLRVHVPPPPKKKSDDYTRKVLLLREAVELVGLALHVDKAFWLLLQQDENDALQDFDANDYDASDLKTQFLLSASPRGVEGADTVKSAAALELLLLDNEKWGETFEFLEARNRILRMDVGDRLSKFQIPISLVFAPKAMATATIQQYMAIITRIVFTVNKRSLVARGEHSLLIEGYPFKLTTVTFHPWDFSVGFSADKTNYMDSFIKSVLGVGLPMPEVWINLVHPERRAFGELLQTLCRYEPSNGARAVKVSTLKVTTSTLKGFESLCSALASCGSLTRIHLFSVFENERLNKWRLLSFALFSRASASSITELHIDEDELLMSDINVLQAVVRSAHPGHDIINSDQELEGTDRGEVFDRKVRLSQDAIIRLTEDGDGYTLQRLRLSSSDTFYCGDDDSDRLRILAPGYGVVFARPEDIIDLEIVHVDKPPSRLREFHLAFNTCDQGAVAAMIRTIGAPLVSLDISTKNSNLIQTTDVETILQCCRNLRLLRLRRATIESLSIFTKAYADSQCRISTLALWNVHVSNSSLQEFATVLADASHPMSQQLREFRYICDDLGCPGDIHRPDSRGIQLFLGALSVNRVLSFFELGLDGKFYKRFAQQFRDLDARLLVTHASDLKLSAKVAFLSCVGVASDASAKRPRHASQQLRLSRSLVEKIFVFARRRVLRVVSATKIGSRPGS